MKTVRTPGPAKWREEPSGNTPRRTIRIPDKAWIAAQVKAAERGENLSEEIRKFVERYGKKP